MFPRYAGLRKPQVKLVDWDTLEVDGIEQVRGAEDETLSEAQSEVRQGFFVAFDTPKVLASLMRWTEPAFIDNKSIIEQYRRHLPKEGLSHPPPVSAVSSTCPICYDSDVDCVLACGHGACRECFERYLRDHQHDSFVHCMSCLHVIDTIAYSYLAPCMWRNSMRRNATSELDPGTSSCHRCGHLFSSLAPMVVCEKCHAATCGDCEEPCHWPLPCGGAVRVAVKKADALFHQHSPGDGQHGTLSVTKQCPHCNSHWEKNGGCDTMYCTKCKRTWRWHEQKLVKWFAADLIAHSANRKTTEAMQSLAAKISTIRTLCHKSARSSLRKNDGGIYTDAHALWCARLKEIYDILPMLLRLFMANGAQDQAGRLRQLRKDITTQMFRLEGAVNIDWAHVDKNAVTLLEEAMIVIYRRVAYDKVAPLVDVRAELQESDVGERQKRLRAESNVSVQDKRHPREERGNEEEEDPEWFGENLATLLKEGVEFDAAWNSLAESRGDIELARSALAEEFVVCSDDMSDDFGFTELEA